MSAQGDDTIFFEGLYTSTDQGRNWELVADDGVRPSVVDPRSSEILYAGGPRVSLDGGRTFRSLGTSIETDEVAPWIYLASSLPEVTYAVGRIAIMAAYNLGEPRLMRLVRSMPESPSERNFWALLEKHRESIPEETYSYVFRIVSAAVIGADPALFGFDFEPPFGAAAAEESVAR
jgi:hypothetical protein